MFCAQRLRAVNADATAATVAANASRRVIERCFMLCTPMDMKVRPEVDSIIDIKISFVTRHLNPGARDIQSSQQPARQGGSPQAEERRPRAISGGPSRAGIGPESCRCLRARCQG